MTSYIGFSRRKEAIFHSRFNSNKIINHKFETMYPSYINWSKYSEEHWTYRYVQTNNYIKMATHIEILYNNSIIVSI